MPDRTASILRALPRRRRRSRYVAAWSVAAAIVAVTAAAALTLRQLSPRLTATPNVEVYDVEISAGPTGGRSVVSFRVRNLSRQDDALVAVHSDAAGAATLHAVHIVDGRELMETVDEIAVDAGESRSLGDGTSHIMLVNLREQLQQGGHVRIELEFSHASPLDIDGVVTA